MAEKKYPQKLEKIFPIALIILLFFMVGIFIFSGYVIFASK